MKKLIVGLIGLAFITIANAQPMMVMKSQYRFECELGDCYCYTNALLPYGQTNIAVGGTSAQNQGTAQYIPADITNALMVATGSNQCVVLNSNGTVEAWGPVSYHGEVDVPALYIPAVSVAAGKWWSAAVLSDGSVVWWGAAPTALIPPGGLSNVYQVAAAGTNAIILDDYGNVTVLDSLVTSPVINNAVSVSGDIHRYAAVLNDGSVREWGLRNTNCPAFSNAVSVSMGSTYTAVGLSDGSMSWWKTNSAVVGTNNIANVQSYDTGFNSGVYFVVSNTASFVGTEPALPSYMYQVSSISARFGYPAAVLNYQH